MGMPIPPPQDTNQLLQGMFPPTPQYIADPTGAYRKVLGAPPPPVSPEMIMPQMAQQDQGISQDAVSRRLNRVQPSGQPGDQVNLNQAGPY